MTLFGDIAYELISYLEAHKQVGRVIVLLQFAKINVYNRTPSVNSYFEQTRMFINANLPKIVTFTDNSQSYSESDDFLNNYKVKNVADLIEPQEGGQYNIVGTIYGIRQDIDWYYDACTNCGKKVETRDVFSGPDSGDSSVIVKCYGDNCINKKISSVPRYKIHIRVQDNSGTITLTLFDRDAYRLIKKRACDLIEKIKHDAISQIGDTLTPSMPEKFEATSLFKYNSLTMVKKRNVGDTMDVDEYDNVNSSTKVP
ncbi:unnamed protein product [Lactuca saligna]|uniref:Replication factor A C-terminal domain-containing protein n=1 Tax=Lactuca saligna TaxID=75948 RepID=A0AA35VHY5_LACSI|nr:unnamed protein product [Lactuca saligna]